jgi:hypothetical protein
MSDQLENAGLISCAAQSHRGKAVQQDSDLLVPIGAEDTQPQDGYEIAQRSDHNRAQPSFQY